MAYNSLIWRVFYNLLWNTKTWITFLINDSLGIKNHFSESVKDKCLTNMSNYHFLSILRGKNCNIFNAKIFSFTYFQWYGDDLSCKGLMVVRALGYYLSSAVLVCLSIDRLVIIHFYYLLSVVLVCLSINRLVNNPLYYLLYAVLIGL